MAFQARLLQESSVKGYFLFFAPSPAMCAAYPNLQDLWNLGPTAAPYDAMHFVLLNFAPHLWKLFAGLKLMNKTEDEEYIMPKATVAPIGQELRVAQRTVPLAQDRSLRNIDVHHKSLKAVDWMHFLLCSGEVLLAGRVTGDYYNMFMALSRAGRLLLRPRGVTKADIEAIDEDIKNFVTMYYAKITAKKRSGCPSASLQSLLCWTLSHCSGPAGRPG